MFSLCFGGGRLSCIALTGNVCCSICALAKIGIALNDSWLSNDPAYAGILPLFLASQKDSFAIVQLLLEHDASPNLLSHNSSETCLLVRDHRTASTSLCARSVYLLRIHRIILTIRLLWPSPASVISLQLLGLE